MKARLRSRTTLNDRLTWQCASLTLSYPDGDRLDTAAELLTHIDGPAARHLAGTLDAVRALSPREAAEAYVATFDMRRRCTLYLTFWTAGDTRNRGQAMLEFARTYREAGVSPPDREAPDYLPVALEFAANVDWDAGRRVLGAHRVAVDVLHRALCEAGSPYAMTVAAVLSTLPRGSESDELSAQRLVAHGPPAEAVGLQPFTLTVPPRGRAGRTDAVAGRPGGR
ncbi:respiratory nitrate reductase chaperone NarJ [Mycolicibacterium chubuense NBB4]|uniref:Respiratory nitrate reductase chaperone NarJ n=1 Tax=Mycolicibacterium chubuense (strain NBB4) TaxID=710421 RepID=I4BN14_MYCCN|nr:nitrate reductase molybdenum cofactor assembly chaperone [Mycolicibacterium chubuense]AFM18671.1 respiratory nitrate reductase chaperone NarJ [Mycolicibacterium chubuense NBB4]